LPSCLRGWSQREQTCADPQHQSYARAGCFIDEILRAGEYRTASEATGDAIRKLQQRRAKETLKVDKLRLSLRAGIAALDRGGYTELEDEDLDAYLDTLAEPAQR